MGFKSIIKVACWFRNRYNLKLKPEKDLKMKQLFFMLLFACFACNQPTEVPKQGIKDILEETPVLKVSNSTLKPDHLYDMNVLRSSLVRNGEKLQTYFVTAYFSKNSNASFGSCCDDFYDKVQYTWANDTVLKFKIFNSKNNLSSSYTLICYSNGRLSMQTDSINGVPIDSIPR